jgi:transcriptional regulator with XRE-family HTH domain
VKTVLGAHLAKAQLRITSGSGVLPPRRFRPYREDVACHAREVSALADASPTARKWELAARLRALRTEAELTVEAAASELMCSVAKISRMETAGRGVRPRDVRDLCRLYGVDDARCDELVALAIEARRPSWWQEFRTLEEHVANFTGLEAAAS